MYDDTSIFLDLLRLYDEYISVLDKGEWDSWPDFFTDDCIYKIQSRENFERKLPLSILFFDSKGMLRDRVYAISQTLFHDPYYQHHIVSIPRIISIKNGCINSEANYAVFRTKQDEITSVFNVGRYIDILSRTDEGLKFKSKICIFDSEMIPNSLIYPI